MTRQATRLNDVVRLRGAVLQIFLGFLRPLAHVILGACLPRASDRAGNPVRTPKSAGRIRNVVSRCSCRFLSRFATIMADADDDTGAASPSSPPPLDTAQLPAKRKIACLACRTIKLRCLFAAADSAPLDPCRRCKRLDLACVYQPKRRPVKPAPQQPPQVDGGKQEGRTQSPLEDGAQGNDHLMSHNSSSSRTPFFSAQQPQHVNVPPNKRRRLPGSEPGIAGEEYTPYAPSLADIYDGYAGQRGVPQMMSGNGAGDHAGMIGTSAAVHRLYLALIHTLQMSSGNSCRPRTLPSSLSTLQSTRSAHGDLRRISTLSSSSSGIGTSCTTMTERQCIFRISRYISPILHSIHSKCNIGIPFRMPEHRRLGPRESCLRKTTPPPLPWHIRPTRLFRPVRL